MAQHTMPMPGSPAPALSVPALNGADRLDASSFADNRMTLVFFYRGVHCPLCKGQLAELHPRRGEFADLGIATMALSMDPQDRAERQLAEWDLGDMPIGYGLSEADARAWGLFVSSKAQDTEPERFAEPGIVAVRQDGTIYAMWVQTVPFARPTLDGLRDGLTFVLNNGYPVRGQVAA